jgi:hypothetical protein
VGAERDEVGQVTDGRELLVARQLDGNGAAQGGQIELRALHVPREVEDAQDALLLELTDKGEDLPVLRQEDLERATPEGLVALAQRDEPLHPPQQRIGVVVLRLDVDRLRVVLGVDDDREVQALRVGVGEAGVPVAVPLHRRAHRIAVTEVDVVAHADLVAVVDDGSSRHGEEEPVHHLDELAVVAQEGGQATPDAHVDPRLRILRVGPVHVVPLLVGDHLERELVVVAEKERPLAVGRLGGALRQDVDHGEAILLPGRHEHARHEREVKGHVAHVALAHVLDGILGPLVGLGQEHPVLEARIDVGPQLAEEFEGLREVLAGGPLPGIEIGHRIEPQAVDPHGEPEVDHVEHGLTHDGVVVVQAGLVGVEAMPEVGTRHRVEGPVGGLEVLEDHPGVGEAVGRVAPRVEVTVARARTRVAGPLEPRVLVRGVGQDELGDDAQTAPVRLAQEEAEVPQAAIGRMDLAVVGNVVPVIAQRGRVEGEEPERGHAQTLQVVQLLHQSLEVADAVAVAVVEGSDMQLVDDGVLVPGGVIAGADDVEGALLAQELCGRHGATSGCFGGAVRWLMERMWQGTSEG